VIPVIIAQFVERQDGLIWIYLLLAVVIGVPAAVALLPSPPSPAAAQQQENSKRDPLLILLIALVFGCYQGATISYSGWIFTYVTKLDLANETDAAYLTSIYWGALTLGRLAAIPLSTRFRPIQILRADFAGALVSLLAMLVWPESLTAVIITSAGLGFALASIYPTTMTFAEKLMPISGGVVGLFAIGNYTGSMFVPWVIGLLIESAPPWSMVVVLMIDMLVALVVLAALVQRNRYLSRQNLRTGKA
jgi:FHS family Na+ dependent glucose MFS transporter 1